MSKTNSIQQPIPEYTRHVGGKELWKFIFALFFCGFPVLALSPRTEANKDEQISCLHWME